MAITQFPHTKAIVHSSSLKAKLDPIPEEPEDSAAVDNPDLSSLTRHKGFPLTSFLLPRSSLSLSLSLSLFLSLLISLPRVYHSNTFPNVTRERHKKPIEIRRFVFPKQEPIGS